MNTNNTTHDYSNLPQLDLVSTLNSLDHLSNIDPDGNLPVQTNFRYYTTREFATHHQIKSCTTSSNCFSAFHANIRSMNANFDNLTRLLAELNHSFSIIGLTETKFQVSGEQLINVSIPGYEFISQRSLSSYGGAGFYVSDKLNFTIRNNFSESNLLQTLCDNTRPRPTLPYCCCCCCSPTWRWNMVSEVVLFQ